MKWRAMLGQLLLIFATTMIIVELGEFLILAHVWLFASEEKVTSSLDNAVLLSTTFTIIIANLSVCTVSLLSIGLKRFWPTVHVFVGVALATAAIQALFFVLGLVSFDGVWLRDFYDAKQSSFVVGMVSSLVLTAVALLIRPWQTLPTNRF